MVKENKTEQRADAAMQFFSERPGQLVVALAVVALVGFVFLAFVLPPIFYVLESTWAPIDAVVQGWWDYWLK